MARKKKQPEESIDPSEAPSPVDAQLRPTTNAKRFAWDDPRYGMVQDAIYQTVQTAMNDRQDKLEDLRVFNDLWELVHQGEQDSPWVGAADIIPPNIPAEGEACRDYTIMSVYSPHLFMAKNANKQEQKYLPAQERWLNNLLFDERSSGECWGETLLSMVGASARDGTSGVMVTWNAVDRDVPTFSWTQA